MKANVPKPEPLFWQELKESRPFLTKQHTRHQNVGRAAAISTGQRQYQFHKRQAAKGKIMDARKGLKKVMMRRNVK